MPVTDTAQAHCTIGPAPPIISTYSGAESPGDSGMRVAGFPSQYPR